MAATIVAESGGEPYPPGFDWSWFLSCSLMCAGRPRGPPDKGALSLSLGEEEGNEKARDVNMFGHRASLCLDGNTDLSFLIRTADADSEAKQAGTRERREQFAQDPSPAVPDVTGTQSGSQTSTDSKDSGGKHRRKSLVEIRDLLEFIESAKVEEAAKSQAVGGPARPSFSGVWKMVEYDGDFDSFMKEMNVGWAFRKAAAVVGYGCNNTYHDITGDEDFLSVQTTNPKGTYKREFKINGAEQDDIDPVENKPMKVIPFWEVIDGRPTITIQAYMEEEGSIVNQMPVTRRYMEDSRMVVEQTTPKGISIKRIFEKTS